jgi:acetyl esterase/lipase
MKRTVDTKGYLISYLIQDSKEINPKQYSPAILILPGGSYQYWSEREGEPIALRYLSSNFCAFILEYTSSEVEQYPTQFVEAAMAMVYIRENAQELMINKNKVVAIGFSAGGHLCGCLATLFNEQLIKDIFKEKAYLVRPDSVILSYPVITSIGKSHALTFSNVAGLNQQLIKYLSLEERVTSDSSPAFIWHTANDEIVSVQSSLLLALAYEKHHVPFSLHIFEKGKHGLSTSDSITNTVGDLSTTSDYALHWIEMSISWLRDRFNK